MDKILSVSQVNSLVEKVLLNSEIRNIEIEGEMSNVTYHSSGHLYFSLKEKDKLSNEHSIKCILFGYRYKNIALDLKEGSKVRVRANISYYKQNGTISFLCDRLEKVDDLGDIFKKLEKLKKEYAEKGYFDLDKKKKKPLLIKKIGVVTSATGAVIEDIKTTAFNRDENIQIFLYPVNVQGKDAKYEIKEGIEYFNNNNDKYDLDALIVGRGGGSIEDLWAFNEKEVIEAIFNSKIFIVSAVGHDTDVLISDFVADIRAATPTQAAEILVSKKEDSLKDVFNYKEKTNYLLLNKLQNIKKDLNNIKDSYVYKNFFNILVNKREMFNELCLNYEKINSNILFLKREKLNFNDLNSFKISIISKLHKERELISNLKNKYEDLTINYLNNFKNLLENTKLKLDKHSHEDILKKGYSITKHNGKIIKTVDKIKKGDILETILSDGKLISIIK